MGETETDEAAETEADTVSHSSRVTSPMQSYSGRDVIAGFVVFLVGLVVVAGGAFFL